MNTRTMLLAFALLGALASHAIAGGAPVRWKGKEFTSESLPADLPASARQAVIAWSSWAEKGGYRCDFDAQGRLMLVTNAKSSRQAEQVKLVAKAVTWVDRVLPAPDRKSVVAPPKNEPAPKKPPSAAPIPEDPESAPPAVAPPTPARETKGKTTGATKPWGTGSIEPDTETAVLVIVDGEEDYGGLVDHLAASHAYLRPWAESARKQTGFTLEQPLVGAFVVGAAVQEEWDEGHEILNRAVQLLTLRRFGQQPNWIVQGIAWSAEMAHDGTVYCFPYRDEFVFTVEHGGWPDDLRAMFKDRAQKPIEIGEVAGWQRGTWDGTAAKCSWGLVEHLLKAPGKLSAAMEELRQVRDADNRRPSGPGTWERIPNWEVPADRQLAVLERSFGANVLELATQSFASLRGGKKDAGKASEAANQKTKASKQGSKS